MLLEKHRKSRNAFCWRARERKKHGNHTVKSFFFPLPAPGPKSFFFVHFFLGASSLRPLFGPVLHSPSSAHWNHNSSGSDDWTGSPGATQTTVQCATNQVLSRLRNALDRNQECFLETLVFFRNAFCERLLEQLFCRNAFCERFSKTCFFSERFLRTLFRNAFFRNAFCERFSETLFFGTLFSFLKKASLHVWSLPPSVFITRGAL